MNKIKIIDYKTGLRYIHAPYKSDIVSIGFVVKAGSRDENPNNNGISHFLEHMLFKGTKKRNTSKLLNELDNLGTYYNAMTTYDFTAYELHGNKKDFNKLLDIFIDLYLGANLYQKDINKERYVIMEEYNMTINDMDDYLSELLMKEIFSGSSLEMPIIGTDKNIKSFKRRDLVNYRNKFYCPANTVFISVGDVDHTKIKNQLEKKIKFLCNESVQRLHIIPIQEIPRLNITNYDLNGQVNILFAFHHNGYLHDIEFNLESNIISKYLTSGSASKLFDTLRTRHALAYSCSSFNSELEDTSVFYIKTSVDEKKCDIAVQLILLELIKLLKNGMSINDLKKCKKNIINKNALSNSNLQIIHHYFDMAIKDCKIISHEDELKNISKISNNKILKAAKHIFRNNNLNLVIAGNISKRSKNNIIDYLDKWFNLTK